MVLYLSKSTKYTKKTVGKHKTDIKIGPGQLGPPYKTVLPKTLTPDFRPGRKRMKTSVLDLITHFLHMGIEIELFLRRVRMCCCLTLNHALTGSIGYFVSVKI